MSDLQYLGETIECAIENEANHGPAPRVLESVEAVSSRDVRLWGFTVPQEIRRDEVHDRLRQERRKQISSYRDEAAKLTKSLGVAGIEPLAIITRKAWYEILRRSGLFVVETHPDGTAQVSPHLVDQYRSHSTDMHPMLLFLGGIAVAVWPIEQIMSWHFDFLGVVFGAVVLAAAWMAVGFSGDYILKKRHHNRFKDRVANYVATHTWEQFLRDLTLSDGCSLARISYGGLSRIIDLPPPPSRTVELLRRIYKYNTGDNKNEIGNKATVDIKFAAVADAISFKGGMVGYFKDGLLQIEEQERIMRADPIMFVESHSHAKEGVVAIIDQFGDFPIEKKVIDAVAQSEHLL